MQKTPKSTVCTILGKLLTAAWKQVVSMFLHSTAVCSHLPPEFQNLWIIQAKIEFAQKFQNIEISTRYIIQLVQVIA